MAVCLIKRYRGLAVLVRSYKRSGVPGMAPREQARARKEALRY
jgi:hypothetical protein